MNDDSKFVKTIKEKPVVSALCAAWLPAAIGISQAADVIQSDIGAHILAGMFYAAPVASVTAATIGGMNMVRHKSLLSKPFSALALGTGVMTALAWRSGGPADTSGLAEGISMFFAGASASVGGVSNIISHYTRNVGPTIGVVKPQNPSV